MANRQIPYQHEIERFMQRHHYSRLAPRVALIDMDGTLFDSMPGHAEAWHRMMSELGVNTTLEEFFYYEGRTAQSTIEIVFNRELGRGTDKEEAERLYSRKKELFNAMGEAPVMPGVKEVLNTFVAAGLNRVLVTGSGQNSLLGRLEREFPGVFAPELMVTGRDVTHGKPHPEPFLRGMQLACVKPSQSIVLENAPLGVKAGDTAGAFTIGVATGPIPCEALSEAGAAVTFRSMAECAAEIHTLLLSICLISLEL